MSLRENLKATVARCTPLEMQHATFDAGDATGDATSMQQPPAIPHGIRVHAATAIATAMQQGQTGSATQADSGEKLQFAFASACNTQHGGITAHRLAKKLIAAAMRRCDEFDDNEAAREEMRQDVLATTPRLMSDLLDHLQAQTQRPPLSIKR